MRRPPQHEVAAAWPEQEAAATGAEANTGAEATGAEANTGAEIAGAAETGPEQPQPAAGAPITEPPIGAPEHR